MNYVSQLILSLSIPAVIFFYLGSWQTFVKQLNSQIQLVTLDKVLSGEISSVGGVKCLEIIKERN